MPQFYKSELDQCLAVADIVVCNEAEARAWAVAEGLQTDDVLAISHALANFRKVSPAKPRISIITQGARSTVVCATYWDNPQVSHQKHHKLRSLRSNGASKVYPVHPVDESQIVDTNGAGDAFVGGFLAAYVLGKHIDVSIDVAHKMGAMTVQMVRSF